MKKKRKKKRKKIYKEYFKKKPKTKKLFLLFLVNSLLVVCDTKAQPIENQIIDFKKAR